MNTQNQNNREDFFKKTYQELLITPQWLKKRKHILKRDNHRCLNCGSGINLQVHHRQYRYNNIIKDFIKPWEYDNRCLITLCNTCHKAGHTYYKIPVITIKN